MHQIKRVIDLFQGQGVSHQFIDIDLNLHVPVDNLGQISATAEAAEGRNAPSPAGTPQPIKPFISKPASGRTLGTPISGKTVKLEKVE